MAQVQPKKFNWWYDGLIDWMLANPNSTLGDCAAQFDCSVSWLSIVKNSDVFVERFAQRRSAMNQLVQITLVNKIERVANEGLGILEERLSRVGQQQAKMDTKQVSDITDKMLTRLGYGQMGGGGTTVVNVNQSVETGANATRESILGARDRIRESQFDRIRAEAIEGRETPPLPLSGLRPLPDEPQLELDLEREASNVEEEPRGDVLSLELQEIADILELKVSK